MMPFFFKAVRSGFGNRISYENNVNIVTTAQRACNRFYSHLVLWVPGTLATILTSLLHCFLSVITSLSSESVIPVTISSIHLLLGRLLLLPSLHASNIPFSNPSDRTTCPKNPSFLLIAVCCDISSSSIPISTHTLSVIFFSIHEDSQTEKNPKPNVHDAGIVSINFLQQLKTTLFGRAGVESASE